MFMLIMLMLMQAPILIPRSGNSRTFERRVAWNDNPVFESAREKKRSWNDYVDENDQLSEVMI
jgi:hypothetical protein